jgi:hypothetical protein
VEADLFENAICNVPGLLGAFQLDSLRSLFFSWLLFLATSLLDLLVYLIDLIQEVRIVKQVHLLLTVVIERLQ